jgi:hypothetical protein
MHNFELGEWRSLFIHLVRIVEAVDAKLLIELDRRYDPSPAAGEVMLNYYQVQGSALVWKRHHPQILFEHLRNEEIGCERFRESSSGEGGAILQRKFE